LAYATDEGLYIIGATGGEPRKVDHLQKESVSWAWSDIRWSPDGKFLSAVSIIRDSGDLKTRLFVIPASGGKLQELVPDEGHAKVGLEWHPDGQRLTYVVWEYERETRQVYLEGRLLGAGWSSLLFYGLRSNWTGIVSLRLRRSYGRDIARVKPLNQTKPSMLEP
jgi:Tol biopolymer transport system component